MHETSTSSDDPGTTGFVPTINLDAARTFIAVCDTRSFRRAAERVHRSPSAVSLQIGKLERQLDVALLDRNSQRVHLTQHGEILLGFARRLLSINNETIAAFRTAPLSGRLRLAAPHDLGVSIVPSLLRRFSELHPHVAVEVRLERAATVQRLFVEGSVHIAVFNEVSDPRIKARPLSAEPLAWIMARGGTSVAVEPLPLAVAEIGCAWRDAAVEALSAAGRSYRVAYQSDTSAGQVAAVRADLAVAVLPRSLSSDDLIEVPKEHGFPPVGQTHVFVAHDGSEIGSTAAALASA